MPLAAGAILKGLTLLFWMIPFACFSSVQTQMQLPTNQEKFRFTYQTYNGTIPENALGKVYIKTSDKMGIFLHNLSSVNVDFTIIEGDKNGIFHAESTQEEDFCFLRVRTKTGGYWRLNREHKHEYLLRIKAIGSYVTGTILETYADLNVTVLDQNEFSPLFPSNPFSVSIPEDTALYSSIAVVKASDADVGINGEIYYSLVEPSLMFAIHPTSGVVSLMRLLSPGTRSYELEIHAEDRGLVSGDRVVSPLSNTMLRISVTLVNKYAPVITVQKHQALVENANLGTLFAVLKVTDADEAMNGDIGEVAIVDDVRTFRIVPSTDNSVFSIIVAGELDREQMPSGSNLSVFAVDKGSPPRTSTVVIPFYIEDMNDNAPVFVRDLYKAEVSEAVPIKTPVIFVHATDIDEGSNADIIYSIQDGEGASFFSIDKHSGLISTAAELDAESMSQIILSVTASDQANAGSQLSSKVKVIIAVSDFNDNAPIFEVIDTAVYVSENLPKGTLVVKVKATDVDSLENGYISYSITNPSPVPFDINPFSGEITTTQVMDFETMKTMYNLRIRASDWGAPFRQETETIVTVKVQDTNDNSPEFEKTRCKGYLSREAAVGTEIVVLTAIDFDAGNIISYSITEGNEDECFSIIPSTGSVQLACDLQSHPNDSRILTLVASDGEHFSVPVTVSLTLVNNKRSQRLSAAEVSVSCQDTDVTRRLQEQLHLSKENNRGDATSLALMFQQLQVENVYAPHFKENISVNVTVSEDVVVGSVIFNFSATDEDKGCNGQVMYVITNGNIGDVFKVDSFTGSLKVMSSLDFETVSEYNLTILAEDLGKPRKSAIQTITIFVADENDNHPVFEKDQYDQEIFEDIIINSTVIQVSAVDKDTGRNAKLEYSIVSGGEDFFIEPNTGIIRVKNYLDREKQAEYIVLVQAKDLGLNRRQSATTSVVIVLKDVNDNFPEFVPKVVTVRVREDFPIGTAITTLTAHDSDEGENGTVTYKMIDGADSRFYIDELTGVVRILNKLDFETTQVYNLSIRAEDGGQQSLASMCLLNVEVVDVDENHYAPEFSSFLLTGSVAENSRVGTYVMTVRAQDKDTADNPGEKIVYFIRDGSGLGRFSVDNNGAIRTSQVLDRETSSHFWLTVYAQDRGLVPQFAHVEVLIRVDDVNDNVPLSVEPAYYASVVENSRLIQQVVKVTATDGDRSPQQALHFAITGGNPQNFFEIDSVRGIISTTTRMLDRERQDEHALEVTISDNGNPPLSSSTRVVIKVIDENDNRPKFVDRAGRLTVLAETKGSRDILVYRTLAYDMDEGPNAEITYTLRSTLDDQFFISSRTGEIFSRKDLVAGQNFDLTVRAADRGADNLKTQQKIGISVVARPVTSLAPPHFRHTGLRESITESDKPGQLIVLLSADDADKDRLYFAITDGNEDQVFTIQPNHGSILLALPVDWETRSSYNLTVSVTDGVHYDFTWVYVDVLDVNDNEPVFTHELYRASVPESSYLGQHVVRVSASDKDKDSRLLYSLVAAASTSSLTKFKMPDESNGVIMVSEPLDREEMSRHLLTVMVRDQGVPSKKSFARVEIEVLDDNDHVPRFLSEKFEGRMFETASVGTSVLHVVAVDQDKGSNSELTYSILSGNAGNTFSIDDRLGFISVAKQLDRMVQAEFNLVVQAADHGQPSLSSTADVHITITVSNNAPPKFYLTEMATELQENMPKGTVLHAIQAESQSTVVYTVADGNDSGCFFLNPNSGVLSTIKVIDYEEHQFFNLTILATNIVGATSTAFILVHIGDENDNRPVFQASTFYGNITESANAGSVVLDALGSPLVIKAQDADSGENSLLEYEILDQEARRYFTIDASTGAIKTAASLDHETIAVFNFSVQVRDRGTPQLSASYPVQVIIYIADVNDVPPRFTESTYHAKVLLPTYKDVSVVKVQASDPDTVNKYLIYSIAGGNQGGVFAINPQSGALHVEQTDNLLDRYELKVQASDGRFDTQATVEIVVEESAESGIRFSKDFYTASVKENDDNKQNLVVIQPVAESLNHQFAFGLLNNHDMFTVGETSGVVQTLGVPFDREQLDNYTVVVEVKDSNTSKVAHVVLVVGVEDQNDNSPTFVKQPFMIVVPGDSQHGQIIQKVTATDPDLEENGEIRYFLPPDLSDNGRDAFAVNQYTGDIVVRQLTEDDHNTHYVLTVVAVDRGTPPLSTPVQIPIHVVDSSSPVFPEQQTEVKIPENMAMHSPVLSIQAVSPKGQKLIYSIYDGDKYGDFAVDFNTDMDILGPCLISVVGQLDYESQPRYELVIRASDVNSASYTDTHVNIYLEDVNDNPPVFESLRYTATVSEVARVGTLVLQVSADDADSSANSLLHYSLSPLSPDSQDAQFFYINAETGAIFLLRPLDHEQQAEFRFLAVATDSGMPARSSSALVHIVVLDINDNAPVFLQPSFSCYITDQAQRRQLVTKVMAEDADDSDKGRLSYSITGGNEKQAFTINSTSGLITVSEQRRPDFSPAYVLSVSVSDGFYTSFARVSITVRNTNKHTPRFSEETYHVEVSEMHPKGKTVIALSAMDNDRGNYGMLTYTLPSQHMADIFSIDADTGEITTLQILDREKTSGYEMTVAATDNGGRMGFATLQIVVKDENDNMPHFLMEEYRANIHFNATIGTSIIQVKAVDADLDENGRVKYVIHAGDDTSINQLFTIDPDSGVISVQTSLLFAEGKMFQFFVRARDQGVPSLENHVPVEILVMGAEAFPPHFTSNQRSYFLQEDEPAGGIIATLRAQSTRPVSYSIVPGMTNSSNRYQVFSIDDFGQIRILRPLDHETTPTYTLSLRAQTQTSPPLVAHMELLIQVRDINDNHPEFESSPYTATVVENAEVGTSIIQVRARDEDLPRQLEYIFGDGMEELANIFTVDSKTGWISLLTKLDREAQEEYVLKIIVVDSDDANRINGHGVQLSATTSVVITVTDYNDNSPTFDKPVFVTAVNEGALPGTVLLKVTSTDHDIGANADAAYHIVGGDPFGQFQIHSTGELFVSKPLDRESQGHYKLSLAATDGGFVGYTEVLVTILDDNDNAPICEQSFIQIIEKEDLPPGKPIAHIKASDKDEVGTANAAIRFTLNGEGADRFMLDRDSGVLRTSIALDRETKTDYTLVATARDGGGLSCTTDIQIFLQDVNDNPPTFTSNFQDTLTIQEDARVNTLLTRVTTVDRDAGINRNTQYRLESAGLSVFSIDPKSGIISLVRPLDREQNPEYNITVIAYNEISPELSATSVLRVVILDVNDNPPTFERTSYYASISEAATVGTEVVRVWATSLDIGANAAITYSIAAGNQQGKFSIGADDGILKVAEPLDHELAREYFLTILARDHGSPPLSNTAIISINITDVNDNPPRFSQDAYSTVVNEMIAEGTEVFKVMATDADGHANSIITYSIIDGNPTGNFVIGPKDGIIQISLPLDREKINRHTLVIQARDSGQPMLYTTAVINIAVEDANDNPPRFQNATYSAQVQRVYIMGEGRRTGIQLLRFTVTDSDTENNGPPFSFDIISGNGDGAFHVDNNGVLSTSGKLSKNVRENYELIVRVFDSGTPPLHSDSQVSVRVVDDSLWPPEVRNLSIHISSCMDFFPGGVIGQIEARDRDPYDSLSFNIMSLNRHLFDVHRDDGRLIALTGLDEGEYLVNISVTDQKFTRFGQVLVTVVCMSKEIVDNAITIQFANMIPEQFYASYKKEFQLFLKQKLSVRLNDVEIINVQPSADTIHTSNNNRPPRSAPENDLDVLFAVRKSPDRFFNRKSLKRRIQKLVEEIESSLAVHVLRVFSDVCTRVTCEAGTCVGSVVFDDSSLVPVVVNGESFVSARHYYTHQCVCLGVEDCQAAPCGESLCQSFEVCGKDVFGDPECQCPEGRNGPQCQNIISLCSGNKCAVERPLTFSGKSYAKWTLGYPTHKRMALSLRIRTRQSTSVLMYAKGQVDYSILSIEDGNLVYRFNCGSGEGQVWVPVDLSDGQWHSISVDRIGRQAEVILDGAYTAMGQAPGVHDSLNLDLEEVYFGAKVDVLYKGYHNISKGFEGCMEDIRMFNVPLPFTGSNDIAHSQEFQVVEFHCKDSGPKVMPPLDNACSSSPCLNGGMCQLTGFNYICVCHGRYKGNKCEIDPDPCQDSPCQNQGQCRVDGEAPNAFTCRCPGDLLGMRCTYGLKCHPNSCQHGGTCIEGPTSALCHCAPGFAGLYCDKSVDVCESAPCQNMGTCQAMGEGTFQCNCLSGFSGSSCENLTSTGNVQLYCIIAGGTAGFVVLVALFVGWRCWRRRKRARRRSRVNRNIADGGNEMLLSGLAKDPPELKRKVSNPDLSVPVHNIPSQPPPVPNRPASYTPSTHDSLNMLNNLDSVRNYGSAADELQVTGLRHHIPDFTEYLQSCASTSAQQPRSSNTLVVPVFSCPPLSVPGSDTESIQKAPWEFEYPNILGNYEAEDKKHHDNMAKRMPGLNSPTISMRLLGHQAAGGPDAISISSLPVSESEDDLNARRAKRKGYHWDTSDWAPRPSLPNISEIPANEVADSSSGSSPPSFDSNDRVPAAAAAAAASLQALVKSIPPAPEPDYMEDSEYVGDSEYAENEFDIEDRDDMPPSYAELPSYEQLLSLRDLNESYELPQSMNVHPNEYLPDYNYHPQYDQDSLQGDGILTEEDNGNVSDEQNADADVAVAQTVAERTARRQPPGRVFISPDYVTSGEYTTDLEPASRTSFIDDMSMSVGGYTSNASCSDISGLCEIEDSEINASDDESGDDEHSPCLPSYLHTQV